MKAARGRTDSAVRRCGERPARRPPAAARHFLRAGDMSTPPRKEYRYSRLWLGSSVECRRVELAIAYAATRSRGRARRSGIYSTTMLSLIHISEPTRLGMISYAVFCLKKK